MITCREFQTVSNREIVHLYRISNDKGEYVELLDHGATIYSICVADRDGKIGDVVLGAPEGSDLNQCRVMGSIIGRCANRIAHDRFEADGKIVQLEQNMQGHFLASEAIKAFCFLLFAFCFFERGRRSHEWPRLPRKRDV